MKHKHQPNHPRPQAAASNSASVCFRFSTKSALASRSTAARKSSWKVAWRNPRKREKCSSTWAFLRYEIGLMACLLPSHNAQVLLKGLVVQHIYTSIAREAKKPAATATALREIMCTSILSQTISWTVLSRGLNSIWSCLSCCTCLWWVIAPSTRASVNDHKSRNPHAAINCHQVCPAKKLSLRQLILPFWRSRTASPESIKVHSGWRCPMNAAAGWSVKFPGISLVLHPSTCSFEPSRI